MILDDIAAATRKRVETCRQEISYEEMKSRACQMEVTGAFPFEERLRGDGIHFICEVKKASPSKGVIAPRFPYVEIAEEYERAGADCISVLTEPNYFLGSTGYLAEIRKHVDIPLLRKDFTVDDYMIYEAKVIGADAVLLICSLLEEETIRDWIGLCDSLGLSALVEAHDEEEVSMAARAGARMIGVNNRNLKTFQVDVRNCLRLREMVPPDVVFVAESGIQTREDVEALERGNVNGVLIGESLMKRQDKAAAVRELRGKEPM